MPCFNPLVAYRAGDGTVVFDERKSHDVRSQLMLACGQCVGCRLERSRQWAVRCLHERSSHSDNCFITLTYSDEFLPDDESLNYRHFQLFMKRLRKSRGAVRFYMCGEYGENFGRPHFHAILFGVDFPDKEYHSCGESGFKLFRSAELSALWPYGFASVGAVSFESAAYVARYVMKKITGRMSEAHYSFVTRHGECVTRVPEFCHMSLKPGIGARWLERFRSDVYPHGRVVVNGVEATPPRYYDKLFAEFDPEGYEMLCFRRHLDAVVRFPDSSPERLRVKAVVAEARIRSLKRKVS